MSTEPTMTPVSTINERDARRRRLLLAMMGAGLAVPAILREASAQNLIPEAQGVRSLDGDVRVNGRRAAPGAPVRPGDTVTTGSNAYVTFVVGLDAYLLRENSRVDLAGQSLFVSSLRLLTGKLLGVYGRSNARRELATRTATIGIRGTGGYLEADYDRTYFCLCYGTADLTPTMRPESREVYSSMHHEAPRFIYGDTRNTMMESAPMVNHTDAELVLLEGFVGRTPPQTFMDRYEAY